MARFIYSLFIRCQNVHMNSRLGSCQATKTFKGTVIQASTTEYNSPCAILLKFYYYMYQTTNNSLDDKRKCEDRKPRTSHIQSGCELPSVLLHLPSLYIHAIREVIGNDMDKIMVFEWMDTDLWSLRDRARELVQPFLKVAAKSMLEAANGQDPILVGPLERIEGSKCTLEFELAEVLVERGIMKMCRSLKEELAQVIMPADSIDFIQHFPTTLIIRNGKQ
ncbi:hypothetical protein PAAG_05228 [Paracoccidioides lutzii Pb01]|uniref:Uncharacterized protein n=1 Tax=Paracoccidioides lutzii (strain ATCC MYA-826 / Pb01) TaxID=502779 RepID=C1H385_PARBA|nr:hypothetical protein PAAG_05228 [Paracoccidioides lutzii Pb01]EEH34179.2 hypothetical protein PAAG_05228 [Paracoccidioides lutzii Pb01]